MFLKDSSRINRFRNFIPLLILLSITIRYIALLFRMHRILMTLFVCIGFIAISLNSDVYLWGDLLS